MKFYLVARHSSPRPKTRVQSSPVCRSYPGGRRVVDGRTEYQTLHVDGVATVELDVEGLEQLAYQAIRNRTKRAKTGALSVSFFGGVESTWSPDQKAWGLPVPAKPEVVSPPAEGVPIEGGAQ